MIGEEREEKTDEEESRSHFKYPCALWLRSWFPPAIERLSFGVSIILC